MLGFATSFFLTSRPTEERQRMSLSEYMPLLQTGLTVGGTLLVSMGTWYFSEKARADQKKVEENERISSLKTDIHDKLDSHRTEYLAQISDVQKALDEIKVSYDKTTTVISLKIDALEKKQDKHNSIIERTYALEKDVEVLKNRESVSENRLADLERHEESRK